MLYLQLALMLAQSAFEIQKKAPGRFLVKQLLKLQATQASSIQVMQNVVCHVGESFEQNLVELMVTFFLPVGILQRRMRILSSLCVNPFPLVSLEFRGLLGRTCCRLCVGNCLLLATPVAIIGIKHLFRNGSLPLLRRSNNHAFSNLIQFAALPVAKTNSTTLTVLILVLCP